MRIFLNILFIVAMQVAGAQSFTPVDDGSAVTFKIKNLGFNTDGSFKGLRGKISFNAGSPSSGNFDVTVDAATIDTDNNRRDNHLRSDSYFDVKNYPTIRFVSTRISSGDKAGTLIVSGKLTIRKVTKEISFPFTATPAKDGIRFKGDFKINRRDYGVGGSSTISDNLQVYLDINAKRS